MQAQEILDRYSAIPKWPYHAGLLFSLGMSFFFAYFDIVTIAVALPKLQVIYHISMQTAAWSITSSLIGYVVGAIILARLADRRGRKMILCLSVILFSVGSFLTAAADSFTWIVIFRFITGMGIGADIALVTSYLSEVSPIHCRGRIIAIAVLYGMVGLALVPFIALFLVPNFTWGYRAMFVIGGLGGLIIAIIRSKAPESIAWLVSNGSLSKAQKQLLAIEARLGLGANRMQHTSINSHARAVDNPKSKIIRRTILFVCIWFFYYIGNYAWLSLVPDIFIKHGFALVKSLKFLAIDSIGLVLGVLVVLMLGERIERKWLAMGDAVVWVLALLWLGWFPTNLSLTIGGLLAATSIGVMIPVLYTYTTEHFPTHFRATGVALSDGIGHIGGAFCGQIVFTFGGSFTDQFGGYFTVMAISGAVVSFLLLFGSKMRGKSVASI